VAAVENARGLAIGADQRNAREALVLAETLREHLLRIFTGWSDRATDPRILPQLSMVMRLPASLGEQLYPKKNAFTPGGGELAPGREAVARWIADIRDLIEDIVFGYPVTSWSALDRVSALDEWTRTSRGLAAHFIREIREHGWSTVGATRVPPLPLLDADELAVRIDGKEGDRFIAEPDWHGQICETGAFARMGDHPLVQAARQTHGDGLLARSLARLVEVASIPDRIEAHLGDGADTMTQAGILPGTGIGQVEAARGRLVHRVKLDGDSVTSYRILAPTEWNFHPRGVVAQSLADLPSTADPRRLAGLMVEAVDPCVGYDLEVDGGA
jgi:hypothetical protein